jgi:hypothetical protein
MRACPRECGRGRAELDVELWRSVTDWLADEWPFERVAYAERLTDALA